MELLFVYGTLKNARTQRKVFGRAAESSIDALPGYRKSRVCIEDKTYPAVVHSRNSTLSGLILSVTEKELIKIDKYETKAYKRKKVKLKSGRRAWAYVKN